MSKELKVLNIICVLAVIASLALIVVTAVTSGDILTIDSLFIMTMCLLMAVVFAASPLLYLKSEGKLPLPGLKKLSASASASPAQLAEAAASSDQSSAHSTHVEHEEVHFAGSNKLFSIIWIFLVVLTLVEILFAYVSMPIHIMLALLLGLSIVKAALIVAYFMHLKFERLSLILSIIPAMVICILLLFVFFPDSFRSSGLRYKFQEEPPVAPAPVEE